jgi:hypothetical protein
MKPSIRLAFFHLALFKAIASAMTVHEWDTFTALFPPNGNTPS